MNELHALLKWLIMIFAVSLLMRPYLRIVNLRLWDRGFALSFGLGTALSFFFCYIPSAIGLFKFDTPWIRISLILLGILGLLLNYYKQKGELKSVFEHNFTEDLYKYILGFMIFAIVLLIGIWIKGYKPEITSATEQYMDYGFVQSLYRQKTAIPEDIWFSGEKLNYYYLGQAATAYLCRLSGITPEYGYPFMLYTIAAGLFTMVFSLVYAMIDGRMAGKIIGGLSSSLMTCFAGNGHYLYYGMIVPFIEKIIGNKSLRYSDYGYFFPDSTTYIGYNQAVEDHGKHEFPAYSFIIGDLHAHVINLLFVIPLLALLIDYAYDENRIKDKNTRNGVDITEVTGMVKILKTISSKAAQLFDVRLILIGILFALFMGSNYWDFPIYFIICGGVILFSDCSKYGIKWRTVVNVLLKGAYMLLTAFILAIPFNSHFIKMANEIHFCQNHSPIYKLLLLWAFPTIICVSFLIYLIRQNKKNKLVGQQNLLPVMLALIPCAIGLIIMPEIVYVKDIYGEDYARFNTMFKLTYQSFVLTGIVIGISIGIWIGNKNSLRGVILFCFCILFSTYTLCGIRQFMGNVTNPHNRKGSSATDFITTDPNLYSQMNAIHIINNDERDLIHILECGGTSYQPDDMISVFTGAPTYVGWGVHEWMWRNGWDPIGCRQGEVRNIYNSDDFDYISQFLKNNKIDYIFVGPREYFYYDVNLDGFENKINITEIYRSEDGMYRLYRVD